MDKRCALWVTGRAYGTKMRDSASRSAINTIHVCSKAMLLSVISGYFVIAWICG